MFGRAAALVLAVALLLPGAAMAQSTGGGSDPLTQEVLRALQQRGGGSSSDMPVQPSVQIQVPPVYPQQQPAVPFDPLRSLPVAGNNQPGLSALERLMSLRVGQRVLQYGYDLFGHGGAVVVRQSGALQDNYVLGEGDEIIANLTGQEAANYRTRVTRDGRVVLPGLPAIAAAGRSFGAFRADIEAAVHHAFVGTEVAVSVGAVRQISVRVVGEVNAPGVFSLTGLSTALDALNLAGGIKKSGSLRDIEILRGGRAFHLDIYGLLTGRGPGGDITLAEGDRIVVPLLTRAVAVVGQVKRPAIYEIAPHENAARVNELLSLAGGTQFPGNYRFSLMQLRADGRREMVAVNSDSNSLVHDGDALFVTSSSEAPLAQVELMGSVASRGFVALSGAPTLHALFKSPEMFAPQPGQPLPYLLIGGILRLDPETLQRVVVPFSPADAIAGRNDLPLQSNDLVYVLNVAEMRYIARRAARPLPETQLSGLEPPRDRTPPLQSGSNAQLSGTQAGAPSPPRPFAAPGIGTGYPSAIPPYQTMSPQNNPARTDAGPFGIPDNDVLPRLNGIPAPRDAQLDGDRQRSSAQDLSRDMDREQDLESDSRNDVRDDDPRNQGTAANQDQDQLARTQQPRQQRPALRLFVGLDDDERELLVRTLGNYYVIVSGEVTAPGPYLVMPQVGLDKVVRAAGGVTPNVDLSGFEVSSADVNNASGTSRTVRHTYHLTPDHFIEVALKPLDTVRFARIFTDHAGTVGVFGEVRSPGDYEITRSEKLSSVLARAGGLTAAAYPYGAVFLRRSVAEQQRAVMRREADSLDSELIALMGSVNASKGQISDSEIQYVNQMMVRLRQSDGPGGRMAVKIDIQEIAAHPELDITLEPGDRLYVPRRPSSVVVAGEVMSPSGIQFDPNLTVSDYVSRAGGVTEVADDDHIFVIQPDGSALQADDNSWLSSHPKLAPGSVVIVPRTLKPFTWDVLLQNVIQLTSQLALTAASISVIGR